MNFINNVNTNIQQKQAAETTQIDKEKASKSKLQQMVNTLIVAKTPTGGQ